MTALLVQIKEIQGHAISYSSSISYSCVNFHPLLLPSSKHNSYLWCIKHIVVSRKIIVYEFGVSMLFTLSSPVLSKAMGSSLKI